MRNPVETRGYLAVLRNRHFLSLWMAQVISQSAQNATNFIQIVLIERLTRSSGQIALVILAFSLPAVLLSSVAGVVVDRLSKKVVLVASNVLRVLTMIGYLLVAVLALQETRFPLIAILALHETRYVLLALLILTFITSAIGQFFSPAEVASMPLLVGEYQLLTANALFNLTFIATQVLGILILAPLGVKFLGFTLSFVVILFMYLMATALVARLPRDVPSVSAASGQANSELSALRRAWEELRQGWRFVASKHSVYLPILQLTLMVTLLMIMAMLAPGFAARVLKLEPEDAIFVFAPAGVGMFLISLTIGRFEQRIPRLTLSNAGLLALGATLLLLAFVSAQADAPGRLAPVLSVSLLSFFLGAAAALVSIPAQTALQAEPPAELRGRVIAVYFLLANLLAVPPLLFMGTVADRVGILPVLFAIALGVLGLAGLSLWQTRRMVSALPTQTGVEYPLRDG